MVKTYITVIATVLIAAFYLISFTPRGESIAKYRGSDGDAIGAGDDADARYKYELMMLRDPSTGKIPDNIREKELAFAKMLPKDSYAGSYEKSTSSSLTFNERGPWNVGGRTRAMAIDVTNENIIIAGTCSGGMWRSTDAGVTWVATTPIMQYPSVACVAQDTRPGHTNVWYYGTGEAYGASASATGAYYLGNGTFKSVDSGKTWAVLTSTAPGSLSVFNTWSQVSWNIVTNPADTAHDVVFEAVYGGVYKSNDGGVTWGLALGSFISAVSYFTDVAISATGVVYATLSSDGPAKGIYRSADGLTFTNITPTGFPATYNRMKIGISPADENQVYFLCNTPNSGMPDTNFMGQVEWNSLWKYNYISGTGADTGGLWRNFSANLPSTGGIFDKYTCQGSYDMVIKPKPNDTNIVFIGGTNIYRSTSGFADNTHTAYMGGYEEGASLPVVNSFLNHHPDQHELVFLPSNPNKMISSNDGGIFRTDNNTLDTLVWNSLNNGYLTTMFYTCAIDHADTNSVIVGGAQDNGSWFTNSTNLTLPWVHPNGGDGSFCAIADNRSAYYLSIQSGKMRRMKLSATGTVDSFARIDPRGGSNYLFINPFTLDPNNNDIMYLAGGKYLWRNDNLSGIPYASNWDSITTNWVQFPDSVIVAGADITAVAVSKNPANRVYFGTSSQRVYRVNNANIGTPTPIMITSPLFPPGGNVSCIAIDPNNADSLIAVFSNYAVYSLFFSSNGGTTWSKIGGNLESSSSGSGNGPSCRWASICHVPDGIIYLVGTSVGLFGTTSLTGLTTVWTQLGASTIGESVVNLMDYRTIDGLAVVATHSHGIFSTHLGSTTDVTGINQKIAEQSKTFNFTNFPNPFNAVTTLQFNLSEKMQVNLTVYDQMGRLVRTLANEVMEQGEKRIVFTGKDLSPGLYYSTLQAGNYSETIKLIMMR